MVVAADLMRLDTSAGILEGLHNWQPLRKEPGLDLFRNFQFLRRAPFGLLLLGSPLSLGFDDSVDFIKAYQRKRVSVDVFKSREYSAPSGLLCRHCRGIRQTVDGHVRFILDSPETRRSTKANAALTPFFKLGNHRSERAHV